MENNFTKEEKGLVSIDTLSDAEIDRLDDEFFKENPKYNSIKENNQSTAKLIKMSKRTKLFLFLGITFLVLAITLILKGEESSFKVLIILGIICLVGLSVSSGLDDKNFDQKIKEIKEFVESQEYKEYEQALDNWYESKGYYMPKDDEEC